MIYNPISTYRIQFSKDFTLPDLDKIIPYLHQLGVRTIYASPLSGSVPGSEHGYDVTNPLIINPETGSLEEFRRVHQKLKSLGMGWIQDIVPNHMAFSVYNPWIQDILEKGEKSEYSDFFDIDWHHPDKQLNRKLMLPVLGKPLEEIIAAGEITLSWNKDCFVLVYHSNEFPLNYDSYFMILNLRGKKLLQKDFHRLTGLFNEAKNNLEACKKIKELVAEKYVYNKNFRDSIEENLRIINRDKNILRELIRLQYYFPAFWKETEKKLNYRRFFTINGMICLKIEKRKVFDNYHSFYAKLCYEGLFQGLRIDHIDGQFNPEEYLGRLRNLVGSEKYIIVEKILGKEEQLEKNWPVQGETGYYFMALVNNLFTNKKNLKHIEKTYQYWNKSQPDNFDEILYQKKRFILHNLMTGDLDNLYHYFMSLNLSEVKQYDPDKIKSAIGEFLINCPVYKIYNNPDLKDELHLLKKIFSQVKTLYSNKSDEINALFRRFMQFTGPLMAKGGEDTAFYTYNRFISNNEVGNYPGCFGISVKDFHNEMIKRQKCYPLSLNATSTHDTKRGPY
jgi:(1->4)-alpha-D-glucan 1-alpha-D-glucosylmutase